MIFIRLRSLLGFSIDDFVVIKYRALFDIFSMYQAADKIISDDGIGIGARREGIDDIIEAMPLIG